jgi:hypothetical protein
MESAFLRARANALSTPAEKAAKLAQACLVLDEGVRNARQTLDQVAMQAQDADDPALPDPRAPRYTDRLTKALGEHALCVMALRSVLGVMPQDQRTKTLNEGASILTEAVDIPRHLAAEFPDNADYKKRLDALLKLQAQHFSQKDTLNP